MARRHAIEVLNFTELGDVPEAIRQMTGGRGTDSVIDAVGMEADPSTVARLAQTLTGMMPAKAAAAVMGKVGVDRLAALQQAIDTVRRGGTISIIGVYGGMADPLPMLRMFDKGVAVRMGQAHVRRWIDDLMPLVTDDTDPIGVMDLATHHLPLSRAPHGYEIFQKKQDGAIKIVLNP
jgi:threonine dehydrogenase-like Zn-dependent dehydrogenase